MNTPMDIYRYVVDSGKEAAFLSAILMQKQNYSIAEIADASFSFESGVCLLHSRQYRLKLEIQDEEIASAAAAGRYVTAFLCRQDDRYQVHFLVHPYPANEKVQHEEEIAQEVVRYMILKTIVALRLTTWRKVDEYLS